MLRIGIIQTMKNLEVSFFVMPHSIVGLNQQTIPKQMELYIFGKKQIYQNGILLSKIMLTKDQPLKTLILNKILFIKIKSRKLNLFKNNLIIAIFYVIKQLITNEGIRRKYY